MEREDFGDWGDEHFLGLCAEDWLEPDLTIWQERKRERERKAQEELELEFADFDPHINLDDDYLECDWEE